MLNFKDTPPSLRKRYITLTIALGLFVISAVSVSYLKMLSIKNENISSYASILDEQTQLEEIRNILLIINKDVNLFLLDPLNEKLTNTIDAHTNHVKKRFEELKRLNPQHNHHQDQTKTSQKLIANFNLLNKEVKRLIEYRLDINKQYPGLDINANIMEQQQDQIKSGFEIMINEIETDSIELQAPEAYPLLLKSYSVWINAISQTRIYMANRLASFSVEILQDQGNSLNDIYYQFLDNIDQLQSLYAHEDSFEGPDILDSIETTAKDWHLHFLDVRAISESDKWRSDTLIMKTAVFPVMTKITSQIDQLENLMKTEMLENEKAIEESNQTYNILIFSIIGIFFLFIFAILKSLDWMVFSPISKVTQALRSKAFDHDLPNIESAKTAEINQLIEAFIEMDEEVTQRQHDLEYQAMHDHLTGLPNRFLLNQRIEYQILSAERNNSHFALFMMDLDFFKEINDTLGHATGDQLLIEAATRIRTLIRKSDTLARLGGDEFAILLPDATKEVVEQLAKQIIEAVNQPYKLKQDQVKIGISIGVVCYPDDGDNVDNLLQFADMAMYTAKRKRIGFSAYNPEENIYSKERLSLINDLPDALDKDIIEVYFQPQIFAHNQTVYGAEALIRWNHSDYGFIPPEKIIESAERTGLIHKLTIAVIEKAVVECKKWHQAGYEKSVAVNLSVRDLDNENLSQNVKQIIDKHDMDYNCLTLEITESAMMENLTQSLDQLNKLHNLGICLSVDDFGTGFSSLTYLKRLPVNELKIDKSFIMDMATDEDDKNIVSSTINLGHNLGLKVVAEGIENKETLNIINEMGCDKAQGYFISKPIPAKIFFEYLKNQPH